MFDWLNPTALSTNDFLHFKYGFLYSFLGIVWWPFLILGYVAGVFKEVMDMYGSGDASLHDLWMTFQGATVAVISVIITRVSLFFYLRFGLFECIGWPFNKG